MDTTSRDTTAKTLTGDELSPEEDPYEPQTDDDQQENSSIYPITSKFIIDASFNDGGRHPFNIGINITIPFDVDRIPTQRTSAAREDIRKKIDWDNPELGTLGEVTFSEKDHVIEFYPEDKRDTKTVGEWIFEQFYYILKESNAGQFTDADIPLSEVTDLQDIVHQNLPGEFITVKGECSKCGDTVQAETYVDEGATEGYAWCDCGVGTSYPKKAPEASKNSK